ncbi:MAG: M3 family oligoendopeptidase [Candidatus Zixiibacteriota bacterium]
MSQEAATLNPPETVSKTWDLESIFPGNVTGSAFTEFRADLQERQDELARALDTLPVELNDETSGAWEQFILKAQDLFAALEHGHSYAHCRISEDVSNSAAYQAESEFFAMRGRYLEMMTRFEALIREQGDAQWTALLSRPELAGISYPLNETCKLARLKLDSKQEALIEQLAVDGYHAWDQLYNRISGGLTVDWEEDGKREAISIGQLASKFYLPEREARQRAFELLTSAWKSRESLAAHALNSQAGFRLTMYEKRGWEPLDEPLRLNHMSKGTLNAMWTGLNQVRPELKRYIGAKKKLLGLDEFRWYDESAPIGASSSTFTWDEAWEFVIKNLGEFSADMREFCEMARDRRWVEGENRPGKSGGGYCTDLPLKNETRIFMTFGDNYGDLSTLAHELGHAYHTHVLRDKQYLAAQYPMNLAETASTFNELLVIDAALKQAAGRDEKLMLLDQKMQSALTCMCNIQSRFNFDNRFYAARKKGSLTPDELSEMMVASQKDAFGDLLAEDGYHPLFWASKLHFYFTEVPFYNFPYTFGYFFATGVYAHAQEKGDSFADDYRALLSDTGVMSAEEVAKKHLNVDLSSPEFWAKSAQTALDGLDEFVDLAG